jgi:hypothetical protein
LLVLSQYEQGICHSPVDRIGIKYLLVKRALKATPGTGTGALAGSIYYLSEEQCNDEKIVFSNRGFGTANSLAGSLFERIHT